MNIYVGNLSWSMTDDDLMNLFTEHGSCYQCKNFERQNERPQ